MLLKVVILKKLIYLNLLALASVVPFASDKPSFPSQKLLVLERHVYLACVSELVWTGLDSKNGRLSGMVVAPVQGFFAQPERYRRRCGVKSNYF